MKLILFACFILFGQINLKLTEKNPYDYSSYSSISTNENLENSTVTSTSPDQSAVYITETISIKNALINKDSGDSTKTENSEFYGVNAAVLVQGGY